MAEEMNTPEPEPVESVQPATPRANVRAKRLRFLQTRGLVAPHGYLNLDEGLHRLGSKRLGESWNEIVRLRCFPFQYVSRKKSFFRYKINKDPPFSAKERRIIVRSDDRRIFRSAARQYNEIRRELSEAIQVRRFETKLLAPDGELTDVPQLAIFVTQVIRAFYAGTVVVKQDGIRRRRRVLLDEKSFSRWLNDGDEPRHRPTGSATFKPLLSAIAERARENGYTLTEEAFSDLLMEAANSATPPIEINSPGIGSLWKDEKLKSARKAARGPRTAEDKEAFNRDRPHLLLFLADRIGRSREKQDIQRMAVSIC